MTKHRIYVIQISSRILEMENYISLTHTKYFVLHRVLFMG